MAAPLHRLIEKIEPHRQGDFSKPLELKSHDELDQLAQALNAMCDRLAEQQHQLAGEMRAAFEYSAATATCRTLEYARTHGSRHRS
ncbi:MAG: HAMP domain-containing protein [Pirellulales bacterium]